MTLPALRGEITIASVITTIAALASFDLVFVTTNGGPVNQTTVPGLLVYRLAFNESNIGGAAALAVAVLLPFVSVALAAYSLATLNPFGGRVLSVAFVLGLTLPIELVVVALYFDLNQVGLTNSYLGVVLAETALFTQGAVKG